MAQSRSTTDPRNRLVDCVIAVAVLLLIAVLLVPAQIRIDNREDARASAARHALFTPTGLQDVLNFADLARDIYEIPVGLAYSLPGDERGAIICATTPEGGPNILYLDRLAPGPAGQVVPAFPLGGLEEAVADYCFDIIERERQSEPGHQPDPDALSQAPKAVSPRG